MTRAIRLARRNARLERQIKNLENERIRLLHRLSQHDRQIRPLLDQLARFSGMVREHPMRLQAARFAAWNEGFKAGEQATWNNEATENPYERGDVDSKT